MARTTANFRLSLFASLASLVAGLLGGAQGIGSPLRWVQVIGLVAAGVGFGAGLTRAIADRRASRTRT